MKNVLMILCALLFASPVFALSTVEENDQVVKQPHVDSTGSVNSTAATCNCLADGTNTSIVNPGPNTTNSYLHPANTAKKTEPADSTKAIK